ncbi:MAG: hypothetical protein HY868_25860 [Chloroflexi bacterium]|nr:hypothetical protein [Chloroflexota bacterium]
MKLSNRLTCAECQAALEFYVDAETRGENARTLYPAVGRHLRTCAACRTAHHLLRDALRVQPTPEFASRALPFLVPPRDNSAWTARVRGRIGGAPLGLQFQVSPALLRGLFAVPTYAALRGSGAAERALILSDTITLLQNDVKVEVWVAKNVKPNDGVIEVSVVSVEPLPDPLRVTMRWKGFRYSKTLKQGRATIGNIDVASLQNAPSLRVDFESGTHGATIEEYRGIG